MKPHNCLNFSTLKNLFSFPLLNTDAMANLEWILWTLETTDNLEDSLSSCVSFQHNQGIKIVSNRMDLIHPKKWMMQKNNLGTASETRKHQNYQW